MTKLRSDFAYASLQMRADLRHQKPITKVHCTTSNQKLKKIWDKVGRFLLLCRCMKKVGMRDVEERKIENYINFRDFV